MELETNKIIFIFVGLFLFIFAHTYIKFGVPKSIKKIKDKDNYFKSKGFNTQISTQNNKISTEKEIINSFNVFKRKRNYGFNYQATKKIDDEIYQYIEFTYRGDYHRWLGMDKFLSGSYIFGNCFIINLNENLPNFLLERNLLSKKYKLVKNNELEADNLKEKINLLEKVEGNLIIECLNNQLCIYSENEFKNIEKFFEITKKIHSIFKK